MERFLGFALGGLIGFAIALLGGFLMGRLSSADGDAQIFDFILIGTPTLFGVVGFIKPKLFLRLGNYTGLG